MPLAHKNADTARTVSSSMDSLGLSEIQVNRDARRCDARSVMIDARASV